MIRPIRIDDPQFRHRGIPVFLVADFNCTFTSSELSPLKTAMNDARTTASSTEESQRTYNGFGESSGSIIDHIFYSGFSSCTEYETVTKPYAERKFISDHYPVKAVLVF